MKRNLSFWSGALTAGVSMSVFAPSAHAHIDMLGALKSRGGDQKAVPCDGARGGTVYTFEPGAIITLGVTEAIQHDSYFRIAFDNDGQDGFKEPASISPINMNRPAGGIPLVDSPRTDNPSCLTDPADKCGTSDFCNVVSTTGATVLWDNIDPHLGDDSAGTYTWTIQLPNVECENCTLQVLQVMEDIAFGAHGPFDGSADIYHRCIDIKLKKGVGTSGPGNASGTAIKVGTPNPKYPDANKSCVGAQSGGGGADAGVGKDAGAAASDAGVQHVDAGTVASPGGTSGTLAGAGGTLAGSAGGGTSGIQGGTNPSGTTAGGAATTGGIPGGATTGGTAGGLGTTTGTVGTGASDDDGGCSVAPGTSSTRGAWVMAALGLGLLLRRKRRG